MIINSLLPPTSLQSVSGQWYIVTTDPKLGWVEVDRRYGWEELAKMWKRKEFTNDSKSVVSLPKSTKKQTYSVNGSKGNVYKVINDGGVWSCSCPAHSFGRGRDCKHITSFKS